MKKLFAMAAVITALLLTSGTVLAAVASSGKCGDNIAWTLDDKGNLTLTGSGEMYTIAHRMTRHGWWEELSQLV